MSTLLLIDGNALIYRAYFALPNFKTHDELPTNAVYGFASMLYKAVDTFHPTHVVVCFDTPEPTFRNKLFADYQMQRPKIEPNLRDQFPYVKEFLVAAGIYQTEKSGFEADDLIGTIAKKANASDYKVLIMTGDKDIFQLINAKTSVISPHKGIGEIQIYNEGEVKKRFGLTPEQIPDLKSLMGDSSDNYKGVPGIGPKTAAALIKQFGSVETLYKNINKIKNPVTKKLLIKYKKDALLSKKLAIIDCRVKIDFDIESAKFASYNENLKDFFEKMEFHSLSKRFFKRVAEEKPSKKKKINENQTNLFDTNS